MNQAIAILVALLLTGPAIPSEHKTPPVHTYSIVARDPATGEMGVAVQSHWFAVGTLVPWAEPGVGVVATQSFVDVSYGELGLAMMKAGKSAPDALRALLSVDPHADVRQVAMVDVQGRVSAHTGGNCIPAAGHITGDGFSVQANMMLNDTVWPAMAAAFGNTTGPLAERLLAALEAAQRAGGDIRGRQAAAILVVSGTPATKPGEGILVNLRVDDHPRPVRELRRLLVLQRAYDHMNAGDEWMTKGNIERALAEYQAAESLVPDNLEMKYWHAATLAAAGRVQESLPLFREVFRKDPNWVELTRRLPGVGLLPDDPAVMGPIMKTAPRPSD